MSNVDFLLTYGVPPLGFLVAALVVYAMARAGQRHAADRRHSHTPAE